DDREYNGVAECTKSVRLRTMDRSETLHMYVADRRALRRRDRRYHVHRVYAAGANRSVRQVPRNGRATGAMDLADAGRGPDEPLQASPPIARPNARRGMINVLNRPGVEAVACLCYKRLTEIYATHLAGNRKTGGPPAPSGFQDSRRLIVAGFRSFLTYCQASGSAPPPPPRTPGVRPGSTPT